MFESFVQDARHAVRGFARGPVFALTAILSLAIGVGATTAIFSLVNALLLSPPPGIGEPDRVVIYAGPIRRAGSASSSSGATRWRISLR